MYPGTFAATTPDKPAVIMSGTGAVVTYAELDRRSAQFAQLLHSRGLTTGDHVAILAENHPSYFEVTWGALRSGLVLTTVNRYLTAEEAAYIIDDCGAAALVTTLELADTAGGLLDLIPRCPTRLMVDGVRDGFEPYEDRLAEQPGEAPQPQLRGELMLYSSGTTGRPKGIERPISGKAVDDPTTAATSLLARGLLGMTEESIYLCPAPLYHAAGINWSSAMHDFGGTVVVMEKFDAEQLLVAIERHRVTHVQVVPTMMIRLLALPDEVRRRYDLSSLVSLVHAAAPCPPEAKRQMIDWLGPIVDEYYSGTEGAGVAFLTSAEWLAHPGSVGRPISGVPHICDPDGHELPVGQIGTIFFEMPTHSFRYHGDDGKTSESRHQANDSWLTVGDVGYLDDDGYLYLTDRLSFTIISGGVNIYPAEIESALIMHPKVADVAVFGLPDPVMGEYVHAVVQLEEGIEPSDDVAEEVLAYAREKLARFKVPRAIDFRDQLPRLPSGKLYKVSLRDEYLAASPE